MRNASGDLPDQLQARHLAVVAALLLAQQPGQTIFVPQPSTGGIYTEALKDVAFRLAPLRENEALEMTMDIRAHKLLRGFRGEQPADMPAVAECLLRLSQLVTDHGRIKELDINPLMVYATGQGAMVADARVILSA